MSIWYAIFAIALPMFFVGLLAATDFVVALVPSLEKVVDAIKPYRGWIGLVLAVYGIWDLVSLLLSIKMLGGGLGGMLFWLTFLAVTFLQLGVGFLVGFEKIAKFTGKGEELEQVRERLAPHERNMGLVAIGVGFWSLAASILFL